jgi:hypothetical protein
MRSINKKNPKGTPPMTEAQTVRFPSILAATVIVFALLGPIGIVAAQVASI